MARPDRGKMTTMINGDKGFQPGHTEMGGDRPDISNSMKNLRKGAIMFCPKCKAKIGMHRYRCRTQDHLAQGITCCVCGYWAEKESGTVHTVKTSKAAKKR